MSPIRSYKSKYNFACVTSTHEFISIASSVLSKDFALNEDHWPGMLLMLRSMPVLDCARSFLC